MLRDQLVLQAIRVKLGQLDQLVIRAQRAPRLTLAQLDQLDQTADQLETLVLRAQLAQPERVS